MIFNFQVGDLVEYGWKSEFSTRGYPFLVIITEISPYQDMTVFLLKIDESAKEFCRQEEFILTKQLIHSAKWRKLA